MACGVSGLTVGAKSGAGHFGETINGINIPEHSFFEARVVTGALKFQHQE